MPENSPSIYTIMAERVANAILGKINALIGGHNTNTQAHQDIRNSIPKIFYAACDCSEQNALIELECEDWNTEQGNIIYVRFNNVDNHDRTDVMFLNINEEQIPVHSTMQDFYFTTPLTLLRDTVVKFTCYFIDENTPIFLYEFPTLISELYNDIGFITSSSVPSASSATPLSDTQNGGVGTGKAWARSDHTHPKSSLYAEASHTHSQYLTSHQDITGKEDKSNKVTSLSSSNTDTQYPSAKAVFDSLANYVQKSDLNNNSTNLDPLLADMIDYGMDNDDLPINPSNVLPTNIVSEWSQSLSDEKAPSEKLTKETIDEYTDLINETIDGYVDSLSWKLVESKNNGQIRVYANDYMVALSIQDRFTLNANGDTTIATISSQYAPTYYLTTNFHPTTYQIKVMIDSNGNINVYNNSTATTVNARIYVTYPLKAKIP